MIGGLSPLARFCLGSGLALGVLAGCSRTTASATHIADPPRSVPARPDYAQACAPSGPDNSLACIQVALKAVDNARAREHVVPMALPSDFPSLSVPEQLFVVVNRERVDRGLEPFTELSAALNAVAATAATAGSLPNDPGRGYARVDREWAGDVTNALDADYEWMYDEGAGSDADCSSAGEPGCWPDRHLILDDFGRGPLVLGAAFDPTGDHTSGDQGGTSLAVVMAAQASPGTAVYTWAQAVQDLAAGSIKPLAALPRNASATHIADPPRTVPAAPDYTTICAPAGLDNAPACLEAVLQAINNARRAEGVKPMVLPAGFPDLSAAQQMFVAINLERVDRGLAPFVGISASLSRNAQKGADQANDPPDPGKAYAVADTEWSGGSSNGLDAVYGWMYDDGIGSGNLDCPAKGGSGCWGHRHGILDNFGSVGTMVMGVALNPTADTGQDKGGTSMAATLAITTPGAAPALTYTWAEALAGLPAASPAPRPSG